MNYKALSKNLSRSPPKGWEVIEHPRDGVYLWPKAIARIKNSPGKNESILSEDLMLFEFHVTKAGYARILARTYFRGRAPEDDFLWATWRDTAVYHCHADAINERGQEPKHTKSIARWDGGALQLIKFRTAAKQTAKRIRAYLKTPPPSLMSFIGHLK